MDRDDGAIGPFAALAAALLPRDRRGARRVALVQEGGGLRGAFGAGVQAGLAAAGVGFDAFDALYGSSAGGLNLMYWVSRDPDAGCLVYLDDLAPAAGRPFLAFRSPLDLLRRLRRGLPCLDLQVVAHAMTRVHPIRADLVASHRAPVVVPVGRASRPDEPHFVDVRALDAAALMPTLIGGASVPVLADPVAHDGDLIFDGASLCPLPVAEAVRNGATDVVAILTLPRWREPPRRDDWVLKLMAAARRVPPAIASAVGRGRAERRAALALLRAPPRGVRVTVLCPEGAAPRALERRRRSIADVVACGARVARDAVAAARRIA